MPKRILIVEDEAGIVTCVEFLMKQSGFEVEVARTAPEALERIASFKPHVVLLDIMLPEGSGFDVCQKVREQPDWQAIKIIFLTAKGRDIDMTKGMALGADDYVTKPFSTRELVKKVNEVLDSPC